MNKTSFINYCNLFSSSYKLQNTSISLHKHPESETISFQPTIHLNQPNPLFLEGFEQYRNEL